MDVHLSARGERYRVRGLAERNLPEGYTLAGDDEQGWYGIRNTDPGTLDVVCPMCGEIHYETTETYHPARHVTPRMVRLKEPFRSWGWPGPVNDNSAGSGSIECQTCGGLIAPDGKLRTREQKK